MLEPTSEALVIQVVGTDLPPIAYVSMCPSPELQPVYLKVIKPTLEAHGLTCIRNDVGSGNAIISAQVFEHIDAADVVLCDLTYNYGPTYYDLGIAHSFRKPTILISQQTADIPFDTRYQRTLAYKDDRFSLLDLRDSLSEILDTIAPPGSQVLPNHALSEKLIPVTASELDQARIALFHHSTDAKRYAIRFLGDNRDKDSYQKIKSLIMDNDYNPELVRDGYVALRKIDAEQALEDLSNSGIWHRSYIVREQVVHLLGNYPKTEQRITRIMNQITDDSWGVRVAVCQVLGKWRASQARSLLTLRKVDPEQAVRAAAEEALQLILREEEEEPAEGGAKS